MAIEANMTCFPGVFTASEAHRALRAGASGLKLFPASQLGPAGIKALGAILPAGTPIYAVGGVDGDDFESYHEAGCFGFGIGSSLYKPQISHSDLQKKAESLISRCQKLFTRHPKAGGPVYDEADLSIMAPGAPTTLAAKSWP